VKLQMQVRSEEGCPFSDCKDCNGDHNYSTGQTQMEEEEQGTKENKDFWFCGMKVYGMHSERRKDR